MLSLIFQSLKNKKIKSIHYREGLCKGSPLHGSEQNTGKLIKVNTRKKNMEAGATFVPLHP
jgi:hypothetical protein